MKTETVLLWAGGAFLAYKLFIAPKTTIIPTQASPIYTGQPQVNAGSNTGSILALGTGIATTIANLLKPSTPAAAAPAASQNSAGSSQSNSDISDEVSNLFGNGFSSPESSQPASGGLVNLGSGNSPANNFGLPTSFDSGSLDDGDD